MQDKAKERRQVLYEKYGTLIGSEPSIIPPEHRAKLGGGLRCFGKVCLRDKKTGLKIKDKKRRCRNPAIKGSLFCRKCGGGNTRALVHGQQTSMSIYKQAYPTSFGDLVEKFINDPSILDLRPELAHLRTIMLKYVERLANARPKRPERFLRSVKYILNGEDTTPDEKFLAVKILVEEQMSLTDGHAIDRVNRTVDTIGKTIERIHKLTNKEDFLLTPDGLKIFLRSIIETIQKHVPNQEIQVEIRNDLLKISTLTHGDVKNLEKEDKPMDAEVTMIHDTVDELLKKAEKEE